MEQPSRVEDGRRGGRDTGRGSGRGRGRGRSRGRVGVESEKSERARETLDGAKRDMRGRILVMSERG